MTDQQFKAIILHMRALIVAVCILAGIVLGMGWQYLP
jgi:hypothetical protein